MGLALVISIGLFVLISVTCIILYMYFNDAEWVGINAISIIICFFIFLFILLLNMYKLNDVEWKITKYEILYNSNQSRIVANYFSGELKIFDFTDLNNPKEIKNYKIINDGDKAYYIIYKKEKKGNFFHLGNSQTKEECIIPIKVLESWK